MVITPQPSRPAYLDPSLSSAQRAENLLAQMTLDEKIAQLGSLYLYDLLDEHGFSAQRAAGRLFNGIGQVTRLGGYTLMPPKERALTANALQRFLVEETRLGIPAIVHEECCCGFVALGATRFPQMIGLASTFRPELAEQMAEIIRDQIRVSGGHQGLAPVLDVLLDPRWGRVEETFGEDPMLIARMGVGYVRGLQNVGPSGRDLLSGVMATGKHFLAHSTSEGGLNCTPVHQGMRTIRETFLLPYEAVVREGQLASMMNSYSELDGAVVAASKEIMTHLLREELGFDGLVVSDYEAVLMLHTFHRIAPDLATAAKLALEAGIDQELPETRGYGQPLAELLQAGRLDTCLIDRSVKRVLEMKFELGLFENPYVEMAQVEAIYSSPKVQGLARGLARQIALESLVLLKNKPAHDAPTPLLPLPKTIATLAVIGPNADHGRNMLGDYSYASMMELLRDGTPTVIPLLQQTGSQEAYDRALAAIVTPLQAIRAAVSPQTRVLYAQGCDNGSKDESGFAEAVNAAEQADVVVLVLGDQSGLAPNHTTGEFQDRTALNLPGVQEALVRKIVAVGKPVAAVLINGRPLSLTWLSEHVPAILEAWLPGEEGGPAIAAALFGDANPGGKLPVSLPRSVGQVPVFYNHKPSGGRSHFRGDYIDQPADALYPFGHGLSYTQFEYRHLQMQPAALHAGERIEISLEVCNAGSQDGDEVVQLYLQDEYACVPRPVKELKGFQRVHLAAGQSAQLSFTLTPAHLAYFDEQMRLVVEAGDFRVMLGSSSQDIRLVGRFTLLGEDKIDIPARETKFQTQLKF